LPTAEDRFVARWLASRTLTQEAQAVIAFRTVRETLRLFFDDRRRGQFGVHCADIG